MASTPEPFAPRGAQSPPQADEADRVSGADGLVAAPEAEPEAEPEAGPEAEPEPTSPPDAAAAPPDVPVARGRDPLALEHTKLGDLWVMLSFGAVILILLLVFVLQNGQRVEVHLYGAHWNAPVGVALLMAAAFGVLLVVVPGTGRIIQLKRAARRTNSRSGS